MQSTIIVVLGMHRSGTSLLSSLLSSAGVDMGVDLLKPDKLNPTGYFEDSGILGINKEIIRLAGGEWDDPPPISELTTTADTTTGKMRTAVDERSHLAVWGFKDPRTCLTAHLWEPLLDSVGNVRYVTTKRETSGIASSLLNAHGGERSKWLNLINEYDSRTRGFLANVGCELQHCFDYDRATSQTTAHDEIDKLYQWLGLTRNTQKAISELVRMR